MTMVETLEADPRRSLGDFLKAMRARLKPGDLGLPASPRRRATGLLREEVALAAGMSPTWYTWMEQGRAVNPSAQALEGIARALRLDAAERRYLFRLARPDLRSEPAAGAARSLPAPLAALLHGLAPHPAYAVNSFGDVIDWNRPAECLLGDFGSNDPLLRNVFGRLFLDAGWRRLLVDWEAIAASAVGQLRSATADLAGDADFAAFLAALKAASPAFTQLWEAQQVTALPAWRKALDHPLAGRLVFDYVTLRPDGAEAELRFTVYTPADPETKAAFARLLDAA